MAQTKLEDVCQQRGSVVGPTTHDDRRGNFRLIENEVFDVFPTEPAYRGRNDVVAPSLSWHGGWQAAPRFLSFLKIGGALKTILGAGNSIASRLLLQALEREGPDPYALPDTRSPRRTN
jgi:hypothetical protein